MLKSIKFTTMKNIPEILVGVIALVAIGFILKDADGMWDSFDSFGRTMAAILIGVGAYYLAGYISKKETKD